MAPTPMSIFTTWRKPSSPFWPSSIPWFAGDFFGADAEIDFGAKTMGGHQGGLLHSYHSARIRACRPQSSEHFRHLARRVSHRRRNDHRIHGLRHAFRAANGRSGAQPQGDVGAQNSLAPLIMFAAGPGTITAVVTLAAVHRPHGLPIEAVLASVAGAGITFAVLLASIAAGSHLNKTQAIVTRFMGSSLRRWECSSCWKG